MKTSRERLLLGSAALVALLALTIWMKPPTQNHVPEFNPPEDDRLALEHSREFERTLELEDRFSSLEKAIRSNLEAVPDGLSQELHRRLDLLDSIGYFCAATDNSGEVYTMLELLLKERAGFEEVGAKGCIQALEGLLPFYRENQALPSESDRRKHRSDTEDAREPHELLAEGTDELLELMISYANSTLKLVSDVSATNAEQDAGDQAPAAVD